MPGPKTPKTVEMALQKILERYSLEKKLSVASVRKWVLNDAGVSAMDSSLKYQKKWLTYFEKEFERGGREFDYILQVFTDAWNYFPHKSLKDASPYQKLREFSKFGGGGEVNDQRDMPKVMVGGHEMSWEQYGIMLEEMQRRQEPFKRWIGAILPQYRAFLEQEEKLSARTAEKHFTVADIFFERVLHVGFLDYKSIRPKFCEKEFPHWWQTHVMFSSLKPKEIYSSLQKLFSFIESARNK